MPAQIRETAKSNIFQISLSETEEIPLSDMDLSAAQRIGRQLAEIGDEISQHYSEGFQSILLRPVHTAARVQEPQRIFFARTPPSFHLGLTTLFGVIKRFLAPVASRCRGWGRLVANFYPVNAYSKWTAGILVIMLLAAAICIDF